MSGGAIFQHALRLVNRLELPEACASDVLVALEAPKPSPTPLLHAAGREAGLDREVLLNRAAAIFFSFCAGNVADDIIDGDCDYFGKTDSGHGAVASLRIGPNVQFLLQNLAFSTACRSGVSAEVLGAWTRDLCQAAGPQALEVRTQNWTAALYKEVAEGIAGKQWAAYLCFLLAGTALESSAAQLGRDIGVVGHLSLDIASSDRRFASMSDPHQREVLAFAQEALVRLRPMPHRFIQAVLQQLAIPEPIG